MIAQPKVRKKAGAHRPSRTVMVGYLANPLALLIAIVFMHYRFIASESAWLWTAVFIAIPASNITADYLFDSLPTRRREHCRIAVQSLSVTIASFLSGWGPVLIVCYAILAIENVSRGHSGAWRLTTLWSLIGIAIGLIGIATGIFPSLLQVEDAVALSVVDAVVLAVVIRMAGSTVRQREDAEEVLGRSEDRFRSFIQNSTDVTLVIDADSLYTYVSPAVTQLLGFEPSELLGRRSTDFVHDDDEEYLRACLGQEFRAVESRMELVQFRMVRKDGTWAEVEAVVSNQLDRPSVAGYVANVRDISERKELEALLTYRALHDPLTGLANRQLIMDRAEQMLARSRRLGVPTVVYFIDFDNFKDVNDSLGHEAGDLLLQAASRRISGLMRASDSVGRMGGDEFVVFIDGANTGGTATTVADRIREVLRPPFILEGYEATPLVLTVSIGIASGDRASAQELLRDADLALYEAKASGRDRYVIFQPEMQCAARERLELKAELEVAIAQGQFFLLYQPIFDLVDLKIVGAEALLRWNHPTRGVVPPDEFIPTLESNGTIIEVGHWVLKEACRQAALWASSGMEITLAVNVSMRQLENEALVEHVNGALMASGLRPGALVLEVTESAIMRDASTTLLRLKELKSAGVAIAIDDFGTGYSSLAHLRAFPVDILKIDRSFVWDMDGDDRPSALILALLELSRALGLVTIAEGIETEAQLATLRNGYCERGQGYLLSRPLTSEAILSMHRACSETTIV